MKTILGLRKRLGFARSGRLGTVAARLRIHSVSEFHSRTVRGKNENLYVSVVVIAVKVEPSEKRVTLVSCLSLLTEIATLLHTALPNRF